VESLREKILERTTRGDKDVFSRGKAEMPLSGEKKRDRGSRGGTSQLDRPRNGSPWEAEEVGFQQTKKGEDLYKVTSLSVREKLEV